MVRRQYKIRWKSYETEDDTWESRSNLHPETIKEYEINQVVYDFD